ncbi:MAG TPA: hypothetical protein VM008_07520 [Phycisphaerae bacterium]|nr:hypothetical protein [Phycisphaerae bacterium]
MLLSAATKVVFGVQPSSAFVGNVVSPAVTVDVEDSGSHIVATDSSNVTVSIASGPMGGKLLGTVTVKAENGIAVFNKLSFSKPGTYTLSAVDGPLVAATSSHFVVRAQPVATTLVFSHEPVGNGAGATLTSAVVVHILDQYGNVSTEGNPLISLKVGTSTSGGNLLGVVSRTATDGVVTFANLSMTKAGRYTLQAIDGSLTAESTSFTVTAPSVATTLAFLQEPTNLTAGKGIAPAATVEVRDQYGHVVADDQSVVKLKIVTCGVVQGTATAVVKHGIATFSGLNPTAAGTYTLVATDGALKSATSSKFIVAPGIGTHLAFKQIPTNDSSHSGTFTIKVDVLDKFGNVAISDASRVTLSFASAPMGAAALSVSSSVVGGVATFSHITFSKPGRYVLKATDGDLLMATADGFTLA